MRPLPVFLRPVFLSPVLLLGLLACKGDDGAPAQKGDGSEGDILWSGELDFDVDTTVAIGERVVVEPGTTVHLGSGVILLIEGELVAQGTADSPITFLGDPAARFGAIRFTESAVPARFVDVDDYDGGSILEEVLISGGIRGVELLGASPYLHAVTFRDNELPTSVETIGGAALLIADGASPRVRDCDFEGNVAKAFGFGGAIYVDQADPILQGNRFVGNFSSYGGAISTDRMASPIVGNIFHENESLSEGGALSLISTVSAVIGNEVDRNIAPTDGAGIHVCLTCDPHAMPALLDNIVTNNMSSTDDPDEGAAGVGAAFLNRFAGNRLENNSRNGEPSDFGWFNLTEESWPDWIANPDLGDTYWGTTDPTAIAERVWDGADNPEFGAVLIESALSAAPDPKRPRLVLATQRPLYIDAGEEIPLFLTLSNPGPERRVSLSLRRQGEAWTEDLDFPGATATDSAFTLTLPADSVWFGTIAVESLDESWDGVTSDDIQWEASLQDESGALLDDVAVARYLLGS